MAKTTKIEVPSSDPVYTALLAAGFRYVAGQTINDAVVYGYDHKDGRAVVYTQGQGWQLRTPDGNERGGRRLDLLRKALKDTAAPKTTATSPDSPPAHVMHALEMLGEITQGRFDVERLRGDAHYSHRLRLLKALLKTDKVLVKDSGVNRVMETFYSAVGVGEGKSAAAKAAAFAERAAALLAAAFAERKPLEKRAAAPLAVVEEEIPAVPHPDAEITLDKNEVRLLEDPNNGITLLQLEKANSQGAICVYNNGVRVAAGVVPPTVLKTLRPVTADVVRVVHQLLNPEHPSVPVTPVANRHLTAVLNCKEITHMATKKFEAPARITKKSTKTVEGAAFVDVVNNVPKTVTMTDRAKGAAALGKPVVKTAKETAPKSVNRIADDAKITVLVKESPYRPGTKAEETFKLLKKCKTAGAFREAVKAEPGKYDGSYLAWTTVPHGNQPALIKVG